MNYKLYRVRNHYHIVGERCWHITKKQKKSLTVGYVLIGWAIFAVMMSLAKENTVVYASTTQNFAITEVLPPKPVVETIEGKIERYGSKYGVKSEHIYNIIACETANTFDPNIQSKNYINGIREKSFGLVQLHLTAHPEISYEQATDPDFAIDFLARNLKEGNYWMWTNCSKRFGYL